MEEKEGDTQVASPVNIECTLSGLASNPRTIRSTLVKYDVVVSVVRTRARDCACAHASRRARITRSRDDATINWSLQEGEFVVVCARYEYDASLVLLFHVPRDTENARAVAQRSK